MAMRSASFLLFVQAFSLLLSCDGTTGNPADGGAPDDTGVSPTVEVPFDHEFGSDGRLYALVNGEAFPVEVSAWGAHGGGHTGHVEGSSKTNWAIYLGRAPISSRWLVTKGMTAMVTRPATKVSYVALLRPLLSRRLPGIEPRSESGRLLVHWGSAAATRESATLPPMIPSSPTCDGNPTYCYDHDLQSLWQ